MSFINLKMLNRIIPRKLFIIALVAIFSSGFIAHRSMLFVAGRSVGPVEINKTTKQEILLLFGKGKIVTKPVSFCGITRPLKMQSLCYYTTGLEFSFKKMKPKAQDTVNSITVYSNDCVSAEGVRIGETTRKEIYRIYGPRPADNSGYNTAVTYSVKGISFDFAFSKFNDEKDSDTLTSFSIFPPGLKE